MRPLTALALLLAAAPAAAPAPDADAPAWTLDPWIVTPLLLAGLPSASGAAGLRRTRARPPILLRAAGWLALLLFAAAPAAAHAPDAGAPAWTLDPWIVTLLLLAGLPSAPGTAGLGRTRARPPILLRAAGWLAPLLLAAAPAAAHGLDADAPAWTLDPWIVAPLLLAGLPCALGTARLLRRGRARGPVLLRAAAFAAGWLALALALLSPLHWLGERLLAAHMVEHEILMAVSAPLLVAARPLAPFLWGLPRRARVTLARLLRLAPVRAAWHRSTQGATATVLHGIAIWAWHVPAAFDAALASDTLHRLQHLSFLGTAVLFWWAVLWRSDRGVAAWHLFATMMHTAVLGALMALAPRPLYAVHPGPWGLTPLEDQQLAGLLMWIPAGTVYAGAALAMTALWIHGSARTPGYAA